MRADKKPLWLVSPRLGADEYREKLMGSVVKYPDLPTERRIPYRSSKLPKELVADLDPKPMRVYNVRFWEKNIHDASLKTTVQDIINAFVDSAKESSNDNVATVARVWHMDAPGEKFKDLLRNKQYFDELLELLQSNHGVGYFVSDIVTLVNLEETKTHGTGSAVGATAQVPVDPSTGIRVGAGAKFSVVREKGHSASYEDESIVFMGYRRIELEKVNGTRAKLRRFFQGPKHGVAIKDRHDYWPELVEGPVQGTVDPFLGLNDKETPGEETAEMRAVREEQERLAQEENERSQIFDAIAEELGIDPVVGCNHRV
ncbi:hypothetical protein J3459_015895 [Metarhizium acridum]|uniref:Uncharacterized protein n=1 Tax=Metarhizium acridum (strain CQMa 102) TaxID=655827 RepID=E9EG47_METAQ|nr:uncharacterized protein MAC_08845 [Metarhizium acridum CQMa 102]EFY85130.1 hypothetical protein MAC_08845 [Metarhizium acridum CQMa 102]KAG8411227.1 hypothetical protein J3459_016514 [Metarhizium acridum]KAG8412520.1 hypothetical protein J3459_015895 [Metarhizium acridum]